MMSLLTKNEENGYNYYCKKLEAIKEIRLKEINATTSSERTRRISLIGILTAMCLITILFIFFKEEYLNSWLTFVAGLAGVAGATKFVESKPSVSSSSSTLEDNSSEN